jgi:hypothetical protein
MLSMGLCAVSLLACGTTLMNQSAQARAKQWTLVVDEVRDGPDAYGQGNGHIEPESGARFLWFDIRLRNEAKTTRSFNYDRCDLDAGDQLLLPSIVDLDIAINAEASEVEEVEPDKEISRILIFTYPEGVLPTRLKCGELTIPLALSN